MRSEELEGRGGMSAPRGEGKLITVMGVDGGVNVMVPAYGRVLKDEGGGDPVYEVFTEAISKEDCR